MESALKESLREAERVAKRLQRSGTDIEYLKNTVRVAWENGCGRKEEAQEKKGWGCEDRVRKCGMVRTL